MSLATLLQQRRALSVPPVPPGNPPQGTEKTLIEQGGSPSSPSSPGKHKEVGGTGLQNAPAIGEPIPENGDPQRRTIQINDSEGTREPQSAANDSDARFLDTDRRQCSDCLALEYDGQCAAARRRELPQHAPWFAPDPETPRRCIGYRPGPDDPDQRLGRERWPNLYRRLSSLT
ncbi:hypothetical protein ThidrDRAFT_4101 [Thiorhodococcus drewsii AZ1]|uniref:Uncharacterized protein n=1 Tax=Thiorhodococcus drewsii AZ1 TaxID=765913 RepID=G2E738_9GAMM|nr:hypothetical protein [Thiorhodococcus drewsii]EGV28069.1 hypothetical protein ThidrDRAFT_4101 [Thiorhodococcus drewsii AZ1]